MFKKITRKKLDQFLSRYATDAKILDVGAGGSGYHKFFPNRLSVDIDPARRPDVVADAHKLPFADEQYEFVLCTEVLEHVKNPKVVMDELFRVLKPGGTLVLTTRFVYPLHDTPHDYWRYTKYGLEHMFRNFKIIELRPEAHSFTGLAILMQRLAYQSTFRMNWFVKILLFWHAFVLSHSDWVIKKEYADIKKSGFETDILATGYYVAAQKPE